MLEPLLEPERAARLVAFADRQPGSLGLPEVMQAMLTHTWKAPRDADARHRSLRRVTQRVALDSMMILGAHENTTPEARAYAFEQIARLGSELAARKDEDPLTDAHYRQAERDIARYLDDPKANVPRSASVAWGGRPRSRYPLHPGPPLGWALVASQLIRYRASDLPAKAGSHESQTIFVVTNNIRGFRLQAEVRSLQAEVRSAPGPAVIQLLQATERSPYVTHSRLSLFS